MLIARVSPGEPVLIGGTNVVLRGGARTDRDYRICSAPVRKWALCSITGITIVLKIINQRFAAQRLLRQPVQQKPARRCA